MKRASLAVAAAAGLAASLHAQPDLVARARAIHQRIITLDTHNDIDPRNFTADCNYTMRLTTQVNLPKMKEGGLDVSFFIAYVGQGEQTPAGYENAYRQAVAKFDAVHNLTEQIAPNEIALALTAGDVTRIAKSGKKVAVIGIENGYPIGTDIKRVREFYDRGGRYMSLAHNGHNQLADSHTGEAAGEWKWGGLSPFGREVIQEMNRVGMMVDVSHPSKASMLQAIGLSRAPVIASHSSVRKLANQSRNLDDEQLMAMKTNGGVVQINAVSEFIKKPPERTAAGGGAGRGSGRGAPAPTAYRCPVETSSPPAPAPNPDRATVKDYVDHIDYAVKLIGVDHVGIASDFDGGGGVQGFNSAAEAVNVTIELVRRGYTEEQIAKIWSGNLLRVWSEVEKVAAAMK
ncbi:MAG TPA: dipeptidase [Vicinamibacterales bacterium]|nr:dipeptidase [Vicinamibacterales bacterium]